MFGITTFVFFFSRRDRICSESTGASSSVQKEVIPPKQDTSQIGKDGKNIGDHAITMENNQHLCASPQHKIMKKTQPELEVGR